MTTSLVCTTCRKPSDTRATRADGCCYTHQISVEKGSVKIDAEGRVIDCRVAHGSRAQVFRGVSRT